MTATPSRRPRPPVRPVRREGVARPLGSQALGSPALGSQALGSPALAGASSAALARAVAPEPVPVPEAPERKHLRVAPKVSRKVQRQRRRARLAVLGVAAISAASMFLLVTFHVFAAQSSFQLDKLENERAAAQRQNELLREEVASRSSATAIFRAATAHGMVRPLGVTLLKVPPPGATGAALTSPSISVRMPATPYPQLAAGP